MVEYQENSLPIEFFQGYGKMNAEATWVKRT